MPQKRAWRRMPFARLAVNLSSVYHLALSAPGRSSSFAPLRALVTGAPHRTVQKVVSKLQLEAPPLRLPRRATAAASAEEVASQRAAPRAAAETRA